MSFQKGHKHSEETRKKISESNKGQENSIEHRKKISRTLIGHKHSKETIEKIRIARAKQIITPEHKEKISLGKKGRPYIKDRTQLKKSNRPRTDSASSYWRLEVYKRDNYKCRLLSDECCGRIEAHHIFNWKNYQELRYLLANGITLCHKHHPRKREEETRMIPIFQELVLINKSYEE